MRRAALALYFGVAAALLLSAPVFAQEEKPQEETPPAIEVGGPPLITDDPDTPGKGEWEVNVAYTRFRSSDESLTEIPQIDANYGLIDPIELNLILPLRVRTRDEDVVQHRMGDVLLGIKWRFLKRGRFEMAIFPQATFNNSASNFFRAFKSKPEWFLPVEAQFKVLVFKFDGEFGRDMTPGDDDPDEWVWGLASRHKISEKLKLLGEVHATGNDLRKPDEFIFNIGTTIQPRARFPTALFSIGRSLPGKRDSKPTLLLYAGAQLNW